jgi:hypothetical protein
LPGYPNVDLSIMDTDGYGNGNANNDQNNNDLVQRVRAFPNSMFHIALLSPTPAHMVLSSSDRVGHDSSAQSSFERGRS